MKRVFLLAVVSLGVYFSACTSELSLVSSARADETVTVTATSSDISENLDLKTVATLFGQSKDLEEFEKKLNDPKSAFSNLDLNGDGDVDYLRVIETADGRRHLVVIQAVLAKDIYQDVASIYVEKDESEQVTIQVVGDEYIYGANYIIEPVYIYRPVIYDWFWGPSWVCWHSPYYWDYWPGWWHPYHCIAHHLYWDHCYAYHHHHPICTYRTAHRHHPHYRAMHDRVRRNDYAHRHPERSFATRNASRGMSNARALETSRRSAVREAGATTRGTATRVNSSSRTATDRTFGSTTVRTASGSTSRVSATAGSATRSAGTTTRSSSTTKRSSATAPTRTSVTTTTRSSATTPSRTSVTATPKRSTSTTVTRTSSSTPTRSSSSAVRSSSSSTRSSSSAVRSSSSSSMRSSGSSAVRSGGYSSGASRSSGGGYSAGGARSTGGSRTR